jgi:predicted esterase
MSSPHYISTDFKARYFSNQVRWKKNYPHLWFVLHGYGQLASYFIRKFDSMDPSRHLIIAPEGLSRFYLTGFSGRIGATWMTKEDRLTDIENQKSYLNGVYKEVTEKLDSVGSINVLGFSQGVATACRWVTANGLNFDRLIMWAGIIPPDLEIEAAKEILFQKETYMVYGKKDPFLNRERMQELEQLNSKLGIEPKLIEFEGEHEIESPTLQKLIKSFD